MSAPRAYYEPLLDLWHRKIGVVRVYSDGSTPYGRPFDFAMTIDGHGEVAEVKGLRVTEGFTPGHNRAVLDCLAVAGFRVATWERFKVGPDGTVRAVPRRVKLAHVAATP